MIDKYDLAWAKYQGSLNHVVMPLISWDIFSHINLEISHFNNIQKKWRDKENYNSQIGNKCVIVTDSKLNILFATKEISELTGYQNHEIIGHTPKMFQGVLTLESSKNRIRKAVYNKHPFKEVVLNYKKDGTTYLCEIEAYPKFDEEYNLINYIAFERIVA
jgi:PAS domain S-box-containing protein